MKRLIMLLTFVLMLFATPVFASISLGHGNAGTLQIFSGSVNGTSYTNSGAEISYNDALSIPAGGVVILRTTATSGNGTVYPMFPTSTFAGIKHSAKQNIGGNITNVYGDWTLGNQPFMSLAPYGASWWNGWYKTSMSDEGAPCYTNKVWYEYAMYNTSASAIKFRLCYSNDWQEVATYAVAPPAETYDYSVMINYTKKATITGLIHDSEYHISASTMKIVNNMTDFNELNPVNGTMYFDDPNTLLVYYFGLTGSMYLWDSPTSPANIRVYDTNKIMTAQVGAMTKVCTTDNFKVGDPLGHVNSPLYGNNYIDPVKARFVPDDSHYPTKVFYIPFNTLKDDLDTGKVLINGDGGQNGSSGSPISGTSQDPGTTYGNPPQDGIVGLFTSPMGLTTFQNTLDKLQHFNTSVPPAPKVTVNLNSFFNAFQSLTHTANPFPLSSYTLIDFGYLDSIQYLGYSIPTYFRMIIGFGFILTTFEYCRRKIYSGQVIS